MKMEMGVAATRQQPDYSAEPYRNTNLDVHDTIADLMTRVSQLDITAAGKAAATTSPASRSTNDNAAAASRDRPPTSDDTRPEEHNNNNNNSNNVTDRDVEDIEEKLSTLHFNITPDVAGATIEDKVEEVPRGHKDDQEGSDCEDKASHKDQDKVKVTDLKSSGKQVEAGHLGDNFDDVIEKLSGVTDKGSEVRGKVTGVPDKGSEVRGKVTGVPDKGSVVRGKVTGVPDKGSEVRGRVTGVPDKGSEVKVTGVTDKVKDLASGKGKGKGKVGAIEIRDEVQDKDGQVASGGNLLPRSPMRPEHSVQPRSEPYHLTSRNRSHCGGGYVVGERAFEPITQQATIRADQRDCFNSVNILPFNITSGAHSKNGPPAFPFVSSTSFPEDIEDFAAEAVYKSGPYNANEIVQLVTSVRNPEIFEKVCEDFGFRQNVLDLPSDIPQSVLDYDCDTTAAAIASLADNYREIPSVSSGYHSSSSPRSTSPQSPGASQERFADDSSPLYADADNDVDWHGTTSEFYGQPDAVFDSGLLKNPDLDAYEAGFGGGGIGSTCGSEVYQPLADYDGVVNGEGSTVRTSLVPAGTAAFNVSTSSYAHADAGFAHARQTNFSPNQPNIAVPRPNVSPAPAQASLAPIQLDLAQLQPNITQLQPNITQFHPDITLLLPPLTQLTCSTSGGVSPATSVAPLRILPKPSLNPESATQRLLRKLDKNKKSKIWAKISTINDEDLTKGDHDGDTQLMILLLQESLSQDGCMLEYVYALVERLKLIPGELTTVNNQQQSVLYLAALHCPDPDSALIARYIAEAMIETQTPVDMVYNDGDTLLHCLCREGAKRFEVLRELLSLKDAADKLYFDADKYNDRGMTPLLEAVNCHGQVDSIRNVRLLIDVGADATLTTSTACNSDPLRLAINTACDPALVDALLADPSIAAACAAHRYGQATPLHCAARRNDLPASRQRRVMAALVEGGARRDVRDGEGRLPAELLSGERREAFKQVGSKR